jgi:hypothetical protein
VPAVHPGLTVTAPLDGAMAVLWVHRTFVVDLSDNRGQ